MKLVGVVVGWLISLPCLAFALWLVASLALEPAARRDIHGLSYAVAFVVVPFYGAAGIVLNPLVFPRLARPVWLRVVIAVAVVMSATAAGAFATTAMEFAAGRLVLQVGA